MSLVSSLARPEIVALKAYSSARSLTAPAPDSIFLDANESSEPESLSRPFNRYPEPQPRALSARMARVFGVSEDAFIMGRGSDEAIDLLVRSFCRPGRDAIAICPPTYGVYAVAAGVQGADVVRVPLIIDWASLEPRPRLNLEALNRAIMQEEPRVKLVFICAPNNPTGTAFSLRDVELSCEMAQDRALVVVDEAYFEFGESASAISLLGRFPNLVVLRTFSKAWALAGLRLGVAIASPEIVALLQKTRAPYPFSQPQIDSALEATDVHAESAMANRIVATIEQREVFRHWLIESALTDVVFPSAGNFVLARFIDAPGALARTRAAGFVLRDFGSQLGLERCIRISIGTARQMDQLMSCLKPASEGRAL